MDEPTISVNEENIQPDDSIQAVCLKLGDEEYAIDVLKIQEIIRTVEITIVPRAEEYVLGVMNLRGQVTPVVDLRIRFNLNKVDFDKATRIVVVHVKNSYIGFVVDEVTQVVRISKAMIEPALPLSGTVGQEYIQGICQFHGRLLIVLDIEKVVGTFVESETEENSNVTAIPETTPSKTQQTLDISSSTEEDILDEIDSIDEIDKQIAAELEKREAETDEINLMREIQLENASFAQLPPEFADDTIDQMIAEELAKREAETDEWHMIREATLENENVAKPLSDAEASRLDALIAEELAKQEPIKLNINTDTPTEGVEIIYSAPMLAEPDNADQPAKLGIDSAELSPLPDVPIKSDTQSPVTIEEVAVNTSNMDSQPNNELEKSVELSESGTISEAPIEHNDIDDSAMRIEALIDKEIAIYEASTNIVSELVDSNLDTGTTAALDDALTTGIPEVDKLLANGAAESKALPPVTNAINNNQATANTPQANSEQEVADPVAKPDSLTDLKSIAGKIIKGENKELSIDIKGEFGELLRSLMTIKRRVDDMPSTLESSQNELPHVTSTLSDVNAATERATVNLLGHAHKLSDFYKQMQVNVDELTNAIKSHDTSAYYGYKNLIANEITNVGHLGNEMLESLEFQDLTEQKLRYVLELVENVGIRLGSLVGHLQEKTVAEDEPDTKSTDNTNEK